MTTPERVPAPAALVRDFVNTYEPQTDEEQFTGPDQLTGWFREHADLPAGTRLSAADLETVQQIREGLRQVLLEHAGHESEAGSQQALDAALAGIPVRAALSGGRLRLLPDCNAPLSQALAPVLDAIRESTELQAWPRLKACARESCRWAYYDGSRNQTRRWCSMAGCGNQVKMRRAYAVRKAAAAPEK
jgi:predicted RNA-binding Zn ribbon-like protein